MCLLSAVKTGHVLKFQCLNMKVCCVGGPANPIANSAVQLLGALQAPQSNTYISNLATSIVQLIVSVASGQSPTPATAALVVQILQVHVMPMVEQNRQIGQQCSTAACNLCYMCTPLLMQPCCAGKHILCHSIPAWQPRRSLQRGHECTIS